MIDAIKQIAESFRGMLEAAGSAINAIAMSAQERAAYEREIARLEAEAMALTNEDAAMEAVPFDVILEKLKAMDQEILPEIREQNAMFWDEDAWLLEQKVTARQREILRAMQDESARQAMKRRKMMHDEGHFPDGIRLEGKQA